MSTTNAIDQLSIMGFKSIKKLQGLKLFPLNILIGANGTGKSNFIAYFRMLTEMMEGRLQLWASKQGSADRILSFGSKETKELNSFIQFGITGYLEYGFSLEPTVDGGFTFAHEILYLDNPAYTSLMECRFIEFGSGHKESQVKAFYEKNPDGVDYANCYNSIINCKVFHFHDTSDTAGMKRYGAVEDNQYLRPDASNLAAFLYRLATETPDVYQQIRKTIQLAVPFFDDFVLTPRKLKGDDEDIRLLWRQQNSDYILWPSQLSDGSIRFICLVTALLQPEAPSTIIIDEPELGLHPYAITLLGALLRSASTRMQVIVSTQSIPLVNEFSIHDLIVVEREEDQTVFKRCDEDEFKIWLEDYSVGELWEKNILGGRPRT